MRLELQGRAHVGGAWITHRAVPAESAGLEPGLTLVISQSPPIQLACDRAHIVAINIALWACHAQQHGTVGAGGRSGRVDHEDDWS